MLKRTSQLAFITLISLALAGCPFIWEPKETKEKAGVNDDGFFVINDSNKANGFAAQIQVHTSGDIILANNEQINVSGTKDDLTHYFYILKDNGVPAWKRLYEYPIEIKVQQEFLDKLPTGVQTYSLRSPHFKMNNDQDAIVIGDQEYTYGTTTIHSDQILLYSGSNSQWNHEQTMTAKDHSHHNCSNLEYDEFGRVIDVSKNGHALITQAKKSGDENRVLLYIKTGNSFQCEQELTRSNTTHTNYGNFIKISADGKRVIVTSDQKIYIYDQTPTGWIGPTPITNPFGSALQDLKVNADGDVFIIGSTTQYKVYVRGISGSYSEESQIDITTTSAESTSTITPDGEHIAIRVLPTIGSTTSTIYFYKKAESSSLASTTIADNNITNWPRNVQFAGNDIEYIFVAGAAQTSTLSQSELLRQETNL